VSLETLSEPHSAPAPVSLAAALQQIAACADALDTHPRFPTENLESLREAHVTQSAADRSRTSLAGEIAFVRAVASVDASTARILDGHFNGVERLALGAPSPLRERELQEVARGTLLLGVWGADPLPDEGSQAEIEQTADGALLLQGTKSFCSGAGGVQRALVVARDRDGARRLAYVDARDGLEIDRSWYRASGLRSSESHLVHFHDTPVLAVLGGPDELMREPYISRDGVRTAATWAGIADCIFAAAMLALRRGNADELRLHAVGRMRVARGTIDRWLDHAAINLDEGAAQPGALAGECRVAVAAAARLIAAEAAGACGARALAGGGVLDRARRDLDLFLLQHRLEPKLVQLGRDALLEGDR
jgi:alkylation response protein AidB-like acyl-CoA dehydrogenase